MKIGKLIFVFLAVALAGVIIFFAVNFVFAPEPGKGEKAEKGYALCEQIIGELEGFREAQRKYPDSLGVVLSHLPDQRRMVAKEYQVTYRPSDSARSFSLTFTYTGPGVNHCTYSSATKKWECHGYY